MAHVKLTQKSRNLIALALDVQADKLLNNSAHNIDSDLKIYYREALSANKEAKAAIELCKDSNIKIHFVE